MYICQECYAYDLILFTFLSNTTQKRNVNLLKFVITCLAPTEFPGHMEFFFLFMKIRFTKLNWNG